MKFTNNVIYYVITPIVTVVLGALLSWIRDYGMGNNWKCYEEKNSGTNFIIIAVMVTYMPVLIIPVTKIIQKSINQMFDEPLLGAMFLKVFSTILLCLMAIVMNWMNKKYNWLKVKRGKHNKKLAYINFNLLFVNASLIFWLNDSFIGGIVSIYYFCIVMSFFVYDIEVRKKFSKANIYLQGGKSIDDVYTKYMQKHGKWFVIKDGESKEIRILQNQIIRIDYYNEIQRG